MKETLELMGVKLSLAHTSMNLKLYRFYCLFRKRQSKFSILSFSVSVYLSLIQNEGKRKTTTITMLANIRNVWDFSRYGPQ